MNTSLFSNGEPDFVNEEEFCCGYSKLGAYDVKCTKVGEVDQPKFSVICYHSSPDLESMKRPINSRLGGKY